MSYNTLKRSNQFVQITRVFTLIFACLIRAKFTYSCNEEERVGLLHLKSYLKSHYQPGHGDSPFEERWSSSQDEDHLKYDCCVGQRISCDPYTGRVIRLDLSNLVSNEDLSFDDNTKLWLFNVTLFLPFKQLNYLDLSWNYYINGLVESDGSTRISSLKSLQTLVLNENQKLRTSYTSFGALTSLRSLYLSGCGLNDHSVALLGITNITLLELLDLSFNQLYGSTIHSLGLSQLRHLRSLYLSSNKLNSSLKGICALKSIQVLDLSNNYISGSVPSCLHNLTSLETLSLSNNQLNGKFPLELANHTLLNSLSLSYNSFEGKLSLSCLANLSNLHTLELVRSGLRIQTEDSLWTPAFQLQILELGDCNLNGMSGVIPTFMQHQYNLTSIDLSHNNLTGSFPSWLLTNNSQLNTFFLSNNSFTGPLLLPESNHSSLVSLDISGNHLHGNLPEDIGFIFPNLGVLKLFRNHFHGHIPLSLAQLRQLSWLDVSGNNLSGEVPTAIFTHYSNSLNGLVVSDNHLQGEIIPAYMNLTRLWLLKANNNNFSGTINDSLMRSSELRYMDISNNNIMGQLPSGISNLSYLQVLSISNNSIYGHISTKICKLLQLQYLDLSHNRFTGSLPHCSNVSSLVSLRLNNNEFRGLIPNSLLYFSSLREIDLRDNLFSGFIASWVSKLSNLTVLQLGGNNIHSRIPQQLCSLVNIDILDLSRNHFYGQIPRCFTNMSFGMSASSLKVSSNAPILYDVQDEVEVLAKKQYYSYIGGDNLFMSSLDLSCNTLSGVIPPELGNLKHVRSINLSYNHLSGSIPNNFANLEQVESMDLSYNQLTGTIPPQLTQMYSLEVFNVSFNNLFGVTPNRGQFGTFDESSYIGNHGLCVSIVNESCHQTNALPHPTNKQDGKGKEGQFPMEDFIWSFGVTSSIVFLATILVLAINPYWGRVWFDFAIHHLLWWCH